MRSNSVTVSAKKSGSKHQLDKAEIKESANGGAVVTHHFMRPDSPKGEYMPTPEPEQHVFGKDERQKFADHCCDVAGYAKPAAKGPAKPDSKVPDKTADERKASMQEDEEDEAEGE